MTKKKDYTITPIEKPVFTATMKASTMEIKPRKGVWEEVIDGFLAAIIVILLVWALSKYILS